MEKTYMVVESMQYDTGDTQRILAVSKMKFYCEHLALYLEEKKHNFKFNSDARYYVISAPTLCGTRDFTELAIELEEERI